MLTLHRLVQDRWFNVHPPNIPSLLTRQVVDLGAGAHLLITHDRGNLVSLAPQGKLLLKSVDTSLRTLTLALEGDGVSGDAATFLRYRIGSAAKSRADWQEQEFSGSTTIFVPLVAGTTVFLDASAFDGLGTEYPLANRKPGASIDMPVGISKTSNLAQLALKTGGPLILIHCLAWLGIIWAYPYSARIQAAFVWSPNVRKFAGLWYIEALIYIFPRLRLRLLQPFRSALIANAGVELLDHYYPDVKLTSAAASDAITCLPRDFVQVRIGHILIRGPSGAGKTQLIRYLITARKRVAAFVSAAACRAGVMPAILHTLSQEAQKLALIEGLIYQGQIDVYIDGLNEAAAEARAEVRAFLLANPHGNILITTQPFRWSGPPGMAIYDVQALEPDQVRSYLLEVGPTNSSYRAKVDTYLAAQHDTAISGNPYDLTIVSRLIDAGVTPKEFDLQEEYFRFMARIFEQRSGSKLPLQFYHF